MKILHYILGLLILLSPLTTHAAATKNATYALKLNSSALQPGQTAVLALIVDVNPGLHVQSHTPLPLEGQKPIQFDITMTPNPSLEYLAPIYPPQKLQDFPGLGKESIYDGRVIVYIPLRVSPNAPAGPLHLEAKFTFQACNDRVCFMPDQNIPVSISTQIVPATRPVTAQAPEIFAAFDPTVFANPAAPVAESTTPIDFFGHTFSLAKSQFGLALLVALGVGVIFNLVPCVLPVVPLKAIGFFEVSRHSRSRCFLLGLIFSLGVVSVFVALALLLIPLRHVAHYSWGEQFQFGWFVWPLVAILVAMSLGMFGLFEVVLPDRIYNITPRHDTIAGNYLFGMLTAVLSTPCTAPMFVGILAWAVAQPAIIGVSIVVMVGVGMALPYLILSAFPQLASRVPRTGPWSAVLKQMMGFLVLAVAVYFAVGRLSSRENLFWGVFVVIVAAMVFLIVRTMTLATRKTPIVASFIAGAVVVGLSLLFIQRLIGGLHWEPYTPQALADARATGKPVLVEFTANWCGNCIALEASVYRDQKIAAAIHDRKVILIRADVTTKEALGWGMVNELNPGGGIPLTAIYGPNAKEPITLTSLYTAGNLIDALNKAAG